MPDDPAVEEEECLRRANRKALLPEDGQEDELSGGGSDRYSPPQQRASGGGSDRFVDPVVEEDVGDQWRDSVGDMSIDDRKLSSVRSPPSEDESRHRRQFDLSSAAARCVHPRRGGGLSADVIDAVLGEEEEEDEQVTRSARRSTQHSDAARRSNRGGGGVEEEDDEEEEAAHQERMRRLRGELRRVETQVREERAAVAAEKRRVEEEEDAQREAGRERGRVELLREELQVLKDEWHVKEGLQDEEMSALEAQLRALSDRNDTLKAEVRRGQQARDGRAEQLQQELARRERALAEERAEREAREREIERLRERERELEYERQEERRRAEALEADRERERELARRLERERQEAEAALQAERRRQEAQRRQEEEERQRRKQEDEERRRKQEEQRVEEEKHRRQEEERRRQEKPTEATRWQPMPASGLRLKFEARLDLPPHTDAEPPVDAEAGDTVTERRTGGDGKVEKIFRSGRREVKYANGTTKVVLASGHQLLLFNNGDVRRQYPSGKCVYFYKQADTTHTTFPGGLQLFEFHQSEQIEKHYPDGSKDIFFSDGTTKTMNSNGEELPGLRAGAGRTGPGTYRRA
eukprot:Hpha_TRINITY_DN16312_c1_g9::TRINITY_DN16312_c1_g9_i1::g.59621::m.59621